MSRRVAICPELVGSRPQCFFNVFEHALKAFWLGKGWISWSTAEIMKLRGQQCVYSYQPISPGRAVQSQRSRATAQANR